jgi:hypothetical protein
MKRQQLKIFLYVMRDLIRHPEIFEKTGFLLLQE